MDNILKGEAIVKEVGLRFSNNALLAFCEDRGINSPDFQDEYQKDPTECLRSYVYFAHKEHVRKYKSENKFEGIEDAMDFIEDLNEEEMNKVLKAILKSSTLSTETAEAETSEKK